MNWDLINSQISEEVELFEKNFKILEASIDIFKVFLQHHCHKFNCNSVLAAFEYICRTSPIIKIYFYIQSFKRIYFVMAKYNHMIFTKFLLSIWWFCEFSNGNQFIVWRYHFVCQVFYSFKHKGVFKQISLKAIVLSYAYNVF